MPWWLIMIIVIVVALAIMFVLYRVGDKLQKKQSAQREQMVEAAQPMNMLIIDQENAANERRRTSKNGDGTDTKALPESKASNRKGQGWSTDYEHDL